MSDVPGLFAAGECASGINGANRLGGNSLSDLLVFGKRAGEYAAKYVKETSAPTVHLDQVEESSRRALEPFERGREGENPFNIQYDLQEMMQDLAGIVRSEEELQRALDRLAELEKRAAKAGVTGNREYNTGWHTALDLPHLLLVSEAIVRSALLRKESRGGHFRDDYPEQKADMGKVNFTVRPGPDGRMSTGSLPIPEMPAELKQVIEETK